MIKGVANHNSIVKSYSMYNGQSAAKLPVKDEGSETKEVDLIYKNIYAIFVNNNTNNGMNKRTVKEYRAWKAMKARCNAPSAKKGIYMNIEVCERWKTSYDNFLKDMGKAPSDKHSLDRIDNSKGYYPENCRWTTQNEQCKNRGTFNKVFTYNNESMVLKDWAKKYSIKYTTLYNRIYKQGYTFEEAILIDNSKEFNGFKGTLKEIIEKFSVVRYQTVIDRLHRGWSLENALSKPLKKSNMI